MTKELDVALAQAVLKRNKSEATRLLEQGASPNARHGKKMVFELIEGRDVKLVAAFIRAGARGPRVLEMVVWAVNEGYPDILRTLLECGGDPNAKGLLGSAVMIAAGKGCTESVELLLAHGADPDAGNQHGTPLTSAMAAGHEKIALRLLEAGAAPERCGHQSTTTPLALAAAQGMTGALEALLHAGASPDQVCSRVLLKPFTPPLGGPETYPLLLASELGHVESVLALARGGANLGVRDGLGRSLFDLATPEVARALSQANLHPPAPSLEQQILAAAEVGDAAALDELRQGNAPLDSRDSRAATRGWTPLMLASAGGHIQFVQALLAAGAQLEIAEEGDARTVRAVAGEVDPSNLRKELGMTLGRRALHLALEYRHPEVAGLLLEAGADPLAEDFLGETAVSMATDSGDHEFLRAAIKRGGGLGKNGGRLLSRAVEGGHGSVVEMLLDQEPRPSRKDLDRALLAACSRCETSVARVLLAQGARPSASSRELGTAWTAAIGASRYVPARPDDPVPVGTIRSWTAQGLRLLTTFPEVEVLAMMEVLHPHGGDLAKEGPLGSPLTIAARHGMLRVARRLVEWGVEPAAAATALETARLYQQAAMVEFLEAVAGGSAPVEKSVPSPARPPYRSLRVPSFKKGKAAAEKMAHRLSERYKGSFSQLAERPGAYLVHVKTSEIATLDLPALQTECLSGGCYVVGFGSPTPEGPATLAVFPTTDPARAIAAVGCDGINAEVGSGNIVDWLNERDKEGLPVTLLALDRDLVVGRFHSAIPQPERLAQQIYDLCPDTVDQGFGTLQALADDLKESGDFTLWWD